jgi:hypothetical protein
MPPKKLIRPRRHPVAARTASPPAHMGTAHSLPPFFLTAELRKSIDRLLPTEHHKRLRMYFDTYGCIRCLRNDRIYSGNALCVHCLKSIAKRLIKVDFALRAMFPDPPEPLEAAYLRPYRAARELLADLVPKVRRRSAKPKPISKFPARVYLTWRG